MYGFGIEVIKVGSRGETLRGFQCDLMHKAVVLNGISAHDSKGPFANAHEVGEDPDHDGRYGQSSNLSLYNGDKRCIVDDVESRSRQT